MNKPALILLALFLLPTIVFAGTGDICTNPSQIKDFFGMWFCIADIGMFGVDIAAIIIFVVILAAMFKASMPITVIAPTFFVFAIVMIGYKILALPFEAMIFYALIALGIGFTIAMLRLFWR